MIEEFLEGEDIFVPSTNDLGNYVKGRYLSEDDEKVFVEMEYAYVVGFDKEETYELNFSEDELYGEEGLPGGE